MGSEAYEVVSHLSVSAYALGLSVFSLPSFEGAIMDSHKSTINFKPLSMTVSVSAETSKHEKCHRDMKQI